MYTVHKWSLPGKYITQEERGVLDVVHYMRGVYRGVYPGEGRVYVPRGRDGCTGCLPRGGTGAPVPRGREGVPGIYPGEGQVYQSPGVGTGVPGIYPGEGRVYQGVSPKGGTGVPG